MIRFQLSIQSSADTDYHWILSSDNKPIAKGHADIASHHPVNIRDQQITLGDLSHRLLDFEDNENWLWQTFDSVGQLELGNYLFQQTLAHCDDLPTSGQTVQLLVVSNDAFIQRLPWNVLSRDGKTFLLSDDWTINIATHISTQQVTLSEMPRVLLACPLDLRDKHFAATQGQAHAESLQQALSCINNLFNSPDHLAISTTWSSFVQLLKQQKWDVIYFYGHGEADHKGASLWFTDELGKGEGVSVSRVADLLSQNHYPDVLYLNACQTANGITTGAVTQLGDKIPALVLNRTNAFMVEARDQAQSFLMDILLHNIEPHIAMMRTYRADHSAMSSTAWMTPLLFQHYQQWTAPKSPYAQFAIDPHWRLKLDRKSQFSQVLYASLDMLKQRHPITLACFWHGVNEQGVERFHQRLPVELKDLKQDVRLQSFSFQWPLYLPTPDSADYFNALNNVFEPMLCNGFGVETMNTLVPTLEQRYLDSHAPLLLHCRFETLRPEGMVKLQHIADFVKWWQMQVLPKLLKRSIHVLLAFSYELDKRAPEFVHFRDKILGAELAQEMQWVLLDELRSIEYRDVMEFLSRYQVKLPDHNGSLKKLVQSIIQQTGGSYERTLDELQRIAALAWAAHREADSDDDEESPY